MLVKSRVSLLGLFLGAFVYWASGTAQYFHEKIEHHFGEVAEARFGHAASGKDGKSRPAAPEDDDHDDCPTCQSLKIMKAAPIAPPLFAPQPTLLRHAGVPVLRHVAPVLRVVVFIPSRAPPARSSSI
jgi:hypothetical protein